MDLFKKDLNVLYNKNDKNHNSYYILIMYCQLYENYKSNFNIIYEEEFIKKLYKDYNFTGVQRDDNINIEHSNFIESFFTLIEIIDKFYKLPLSNTMNIIESNIITITDNTVKPFKTGLMDFLNYINLYSYIYKNNLESDIDIIIQNKRFFIALLQYDKDVLTNYNYPICLNNLREHMDKLKEYQESTYPLLWMIQQLIVSHPEHSVCAMNIMTQLFNFYISKYDERLRIIMTRIFTINIDARYTRIFTVFLEIFFDKYPNTDIEDINLDECKAKESIIVSCKNISFRICNPTPDIYENPEVLCN
jgi:hypothetical protein